MLVKYHWYFRILLLALAIVAIFTMSIRYNDFSILFSGTLFYFLGSAITFNNRNYRIFQIAFCWLVCFGVLQAFFFQAEYNQLFDSGGDDQSFYKNWILVGYNDFNFIVNEKYPYKTFIIPATAYLRFINDIGFNSLFSFHINLLNIFFASLIPVLVFKIANKLYDKKIAQFSAFAIIFYPFFNYQCTKIMRDVYIYLFFTFAVYVLISDWRGTTKLLIFFLLLFFTANVRTEGTIYFIILFGSYLFMKTKSIPIKLFYVFILLLTIAAVYKYLNATYNISLDSIGRYSDMYDELRAGEGTSGSIATKLKNAGVIGKFLSVPYNWLSPLPPPAFILANYFNIFISLGCFCWYYLFPRGVIRIWEDARNNKNFDKQLVVISLLITFLIGSLFISYTSGEPRHILVFFPVFMIFCVAYFKNRDFQYELYLNYAMVIMSMLAIVVYVYVKFLA